MKRLLFLLLPISIASNAYGQTFLNGSFENNIVTYCMINNITNSAFDSLMSDVKGIGLTQTIDIFYDTDCPSYGNANTGHYYVSVENNSSDSTQSTAISLKLADTLETGVPYSFCFYDRAIAGIGYGPVEIGISNSDSTFGILIYTSPLIDTIWTMRTVNFNSPITARYVTVKYGSSNGGAIVDNFGACSGTGIDGQTKIERVKVFPNPFSNQLTFTLSGNEQTTVSIYDFLGQQILQQTFKNSTTLNTEQFSDGIYFYVLKNTKRIISNGKIIKN